MTYLRLHVVVFRKSNRPRRTFRRRPPTVVFRLGKFQLMVLIYGLKTITNARLILA
jgi:hypothetical protein